MHGGLHGFRPPTLPPGNQDFTLFRSFSDPLKTYLYPLVLSYRTHYPSYPLTYLLTLLPYYLMMLSYSLKLSYSYSYLLKNQQPERVKEKG